MCAPPAAASGSGSCLQAGDFERYYHSGPVGGEESPGILLGARVVGDWTQALNEYALRESDSIRALAGSGSGSGSGSPVVPVPVQVMFDGPYGGCSIDLASYERVLLVSGGSGATFAVGVLDELVAACCFGDRDGKKVKAVDKVEFVWCTRSFGPFFFLFVFLTFTDC